MISPDDMDNRAGAWIDAWNSRDLERILALYADHCEMTSPHIVARGLDDSGTVTGKDRLRRYWGAALARLPGLRFDANGLIVQGAAHHAAGDA